MIAIPERITKNSEDEIEKQVADMQKYLDYLTERINKALLELSGKVNEIDTKITLLGGNSND